MTIHLYGLIVSLVVLALFFVYLCKTEEYTGQPLTEREMVVMLVIASLVGFFFWDVLIQLVFHVL